MLASAHNTVCRNVNKQRLVRHANDIVFRLLWCGVQVSFIKILGLLHQILLDSS
jgi:hypothetical protein